MEQSTFFQQLHEPNEQVSHMQARHQSPATFNLPRPTRQVNPPAHDPFLDQINDVQTHIAHLDESLRGARGVGLELYPPPQPQWPLHAEPMDQAPIPSISSFGEPISAREPGNAQIAQMLTNLYAHLDTGLRDTASDIAALEERLDRLEPTRFTPPGSEMSESDRAAPASEMMNPVSSDKSHLFLSSQIGHDSAADLTLQLKADAARSAIATLDSCTKQIAKREHEFAVSDAKELIQDVFKFNRQLMDFSDRALPTALPLFAKPEQYQTSAELGESRLHRPLATELANNSKAEDPHPSAYSPEREFPDMYAPHVRQTQARTLDIAPEGVAFRDQELNRMDELLKNSQEHLRDSQEALAHQATQLHDLQEASKEKDCRIHEWREAYYELKSSTESQAAAFQDFCEQKDAIIYEQEQIIARGARLLEQRDNEIDGLGRSLRAAEDDKVHEMRQVARTARLLDDMKSRQAAMRDEIRTACAFPVRSPRRPNGELRDPDRQLALAKSRIARCAEVVGVPTPSEYDLEETVLQNGVKAVCAVLKADRRHVHKLWNEPGYLGAQGEDSPSWSPQPIKGNRRLPNEVRRASYWKQDGRAEQQPQFGKPSEIGGHEREEEKHAQQHDSLSPKQVRTSAGSTYSAPNGQAEKVRLETGDGSPMGFTPQVSAGRVAPAVELQEPAERGRRVHNMQQADSRAADVRTPKPYSPDLTLHPPLPVPVADTPAAGETSMTRERHVQNIARMHSMQDMTAAAPESAEIIELNHYGQRRIPKHQSMQDLHRRSFQMYQPYVETEADNVGELGGEV